MRKAFIYALDYDTFINEVLKGLGRKIPTDLPEGLLGFNEELLNDPDAPHFDIVKATEYFKKAWNGEVWEKGFKITLLYNTGNDVRRQAAEMLKAYIEMINPTKFKVEVRGVQWPTYLDATKRGEVPVFIIGWLADYPDPHNFIFTYYHSAGVYSGRQGENFRKFISTPHPDLGGRSLDELIEEAIAKTDPAERQALYEEIQRFAMKHALGMPLYQPLGVRVQRSWVKGWYYNPMRPGDDYYVLWKAEE